MFPGYFHGSAATAGVRPASRLNSTIKCGRFIGPNYHSSAIAGGKRIGSDEGIATDETVSGIGDRTPAAFFPTDSQGSAAGDAGCVEFGIQDGNAIANNRNALSGWSIRSPIADIQGSRGNGGAGFGSNF
ncbi:hypothetical protein [Oscillatoria sp. HE19RPO]|uniref:hypothetical protein n=1 Tax=Oscillatoria sp. HE19RPO TaxID=2954806 RepID=UPI0020C4BB57|nr:hypothetical protein [Oscillatoria sp. HE19RPO]